MLSQLFYCSFVHLHFFTSLDLGGVLWTWAHWRQKNSRKWACMPCQPVDLILRFFQYRVSRIWELYDWRRKAWQKDCLLVHGKVPSSLLAVLFITSIPGRDVKIEILLSRRSIGRRLLIFRTQVQDYETTCFVRRLTLLTFRRIKLFAQFR